MRHIIYIISLVVSITGLAQPSRIITAGSSTSEIVCALGCTSKIIATDRTSLYPETLQLLPSIGYRTGIGAEGIVSLNPDLVILEKDYVKEDVISQLQSTGIKILVVNAEQNFESTKLRIKVIAEHLNKKVEGDAMIKDIETKLALVAKKVNTTKIRPTVLCVYARGTGSMQVAGKNTSFELLPLGGTQNVMSDIEGYKPLNAESLIQANPDYILFFTNGLESIGGVDGALQIAGVQQTTAGKKKQIIHMDGIMLTNWGPRVAEAAEELFSLTHPEAKK